MEKCVYCPCGEDCNDAITVRPAISDPTYMQPICAACLSHIERGCADEECPICPSDMSLEEAIGEFIELGFTVTFVEPISQDNRED
jgi:hypothetical protein